MKTVSSDSIAWDTANSCAVTESSNFGKDFVFEQLFIGHPEFGLAIKSEQTGTITLWMIKDIKQNKDKEITEWVCVPIPEAIRKHPMLKHYSLTIFND